MNLITKLGLLSLCVLSAGAIFAADDTKDSDYQKQQEINEAAKQNAQARQNPMDMVHTTAGNRIARVTRVIPPDLGKLTAQYAYDVVWAWDEQNGVPLLKINAAHFFLEGDNYHTTPEFKARFEHARKDLTLKFVRSIEEPRFPIRHQSDIGRIIAAHIKNSEGDFCIANERGTPLRTLTKTRSDKSYYFGFFDEGTCVCPQDSHQLHHSVDTVYTLDIGGHCYTLRQQWDQEDNPGWDQWFAYGAFVLPIATWATALAIQQLWGAK